MLGHVPLQHVADGVAGRAPVVVDHALGVAGGAAGVVECYRIPLIGGQAPRKLRIAARHKRVVRDAAQGLAGGAVQGVFHLNDQQGCRTLAQRQRLGHDGGELGVDDDGLGLAVVEHESYRFGV